MWGYMRSLHLERRAASADDSELRETVAHLEAEVAAVRAERRARRVSLTFVVVFPVRSSYLGLETLCRRQPS